MVIWKWPLKLDPYQAVEMPAGATVLTVQVQKDEPHLWALCDPERPKEKRHITMRGTGHPVPAYPGQYLGTVQMFRGDLVLHVYEIADPNLAGKPVLEERDG